MYRKSTRQRVILAVLLAASATVVTLDFRENPGGPVRRIQSVAVSVVAPLQNGIARIFRPVGDFLSSLGELASIRRENEQLRAQVKALESQQRNYPEVVRENSRLEALLQVRDWSKGRQLGARVIGVGPSNYEWAAFIDRGGNDGVKTDMAVVSSEGLVGRVVLVSDHYSKVILAIDPQHSVGARLTGSGETGVVTGRGREDLRFDLISADTSVAKGETVVTSGYDRGIYPGGIPIGAVTGIETAPSGLEKSAFVRPFVDFSRLDVVKILLDSGQVS